MLAASENDGFRHVRHQLHGSYNGLESEQHGVHHWAQKGIVTRGVLLIRTGWVGWYRQLDETRRRALGEQTMAPSCGLAARESTAAMLWDLHIAAVGTDTPAFEVVPFGGVSGAELGAALRDPERSLDVFLHFRILGLLGIPIGERWDLEALGADCAADCAADGVYEFLLTSAPLNLHNGVGSPANALAVN